MVLSRLPSTLALIAALATSLSLGAAEGQSADKAPALNTVCPMCNKDVDAAKSPSVPITVGEGAEAKHFRMVMCSDNCCVSFKKDPEAALKPRFGKDAAGPKTNFK